MTAAQTIPAASAELIDAWVATLPARGPVEATQGLQRAAVTALAAHVTPVALLEATTEQIAEWVAGYRDRDTQRTHLAAARLFYQWALDGRLVDANPVTSLVERRGRPRRPREPVPTARPS